MDKTSGNGSKPKWTRIEEKSSRCTLTGRPWQERYIPLRFCILSYPIFQEREKESLGHCTFALFYRNEEEGNGGEEGSENGSFYLV